MGWNKILGTDKKGTPCYYWVVKAFRSMKKMMPCKDWNPTSPDAPAWQIQAVIEAMRGRGWYLIWHNDNKENIIRAEFYSVHPYKRVIEYNIDPHIATVLAAYRAVEGEK
jgi:hypothetical protein